MGIPGFTKFINDNEDKLFHTYELHETTVIIKGLSISCELYKRWIFKTRSHNCFGGDYDKFAHFVEFFFNMLTSVNVKPIVVFDGGYDERKLQSKLSKMKTQIKVAADLYPNMETRPPSDVTFPLFLIEALKDVLRKLRIEMFICEYEADSEIAAIAKTLNCPVITFDSDYFLFGADYIPFNRIGSELTTSVTGQYKYVACEMYRLENLLRMYKGITKNSLFIIPVLLAQDMYTSRFKMFLQSIHVDTRQRQRQRRIGQLLEWLKKDTPENTIKQIVNSFDGTKEKLEIFNIIQETVSSYQFTLGRVFDHLQLTFQASTENIDFDRLKQTLNIDSETFLYHFTKAQYPSSFMDILSQNKYYCTPQYEDYSQENSHVLSYPILRAIHKVLTQNSSDNLTIVAWEDDTSIKHYSQNVYKESLPSVEEIENLPLEDRQNLLLKILNIDLNFIKFLNNLPSNWHTLLISLKYVSCKITMNAELIQAIILCFVILNYIDQQIGYHRTLASLAELKKESVFNMPGLLSSLETQPLRADINCFNNLPKPECLKFMENLVKFFETYKGTFDKKLIHTMAQIQSVFLHVKYLNSLLNLPFPELQIISIMNCTFIYNATVDLSGRNNEDDVFTLFCENCPTILSALNYTKNILKSEFKV